MCIICSGEVLGNLLERTELDISGCGVVTAVPSELVNLRSLKADNCPHLETIPRLEKLERITTSDSRIRSFSGFPNLVHLEVEENLRIDELSDLPEVCWMSFRSCNIECDISGFPKLTYLTISRCEVGYLYDLPSLIYLDCSFTILDETDISIESLYTLVCSGCPVGKLSGLQFLQTLVCQSCPFLTEISDMPCLRIICCNYCASLTKVTANDMIPKLFHCCCCPMLIESPMSLSKHTVDNLISSDTARQVRNLLNYGYEINSQTTVRFASTGTPWVQNHWENNNNKYEESPTFFKNLKSVKVIQRFANKCKRSKAFKQWTKTRGFAEWFYAPDRLGGRVDRLRFSKFVDSLKQN